MSATPDTDRSFLEAASPSYLQALCAIREFRREVQERCDRVVRPRLAEQASALGLPLNEDMIAPYSRPEKLSNWSGSSANLGVRLVAREGTVELYYVMSWEQEQAGDPSISAVVSVWVKGRHTVARIWEEVKKTGHPRLYAWENLIVLAKPLAAGQIGAFDESLEGLITEWSGVWERTGGLNKFVSPPAS